jgi:predicted RNA-binding Zn ribbon-like protein
MMPRPDAVLVADDLGLDFLNSIATPADVVVDWLDSGEGLLSWLEQARMVPAEGLQALREQAMPDELDGVAAQARRLRDWFRAFVEAHKGRPLGARDLADLAPLNRLLERDEIFERVVAKDDGDGLDLVSARRWRTPDSLLLPIGEALARTVCDVDFRDIKACEGHVCTLLFVDRTRGRGRRWCSMAVCGNRAKQAAHRSRAKTGRSSSTRS